MADEEDVLSDVSDKNDKDSQYFKCCATKNCKFKVCIQCFAIFHQACAKKNPNLKFLTGTKVICCYGSSETKEKQTEEMKSDNNAMEIKYLKELLKESRDKNEILKFNNSLLIDKIKTLENRESIKTKVNINEKIPLIRLTGDESKTQTPNTGTTETYTYARATRSATVQQRAPQENLQSRKISTHRPMNTETSITNDNDNLTFNLNEQNTTNITNRTGQNNQNEREEFTEVDRRRNNRIKYQRKNNKNLGTAEVSDEANKTGFSGGERKVWLYVYRVKRVANETHIKDYLLKKPGFHGDSITVKEIPSDENQLKRFVVTAPLEKKDEMYKPEFWPKYVAVKRFDFERHRQFLNCYNNKKTKHVYIIQLDTSKLTVNCKLYR